MNLCLLVHPLQILSAILALAAYRSILQRKPLDDQSPSLTVFCNLLKN
jgi:hypothetical protein